MKSLSADDQTAAGSGDAVVNFDLIFHSVAAATSHVFIFLSLSFTVAHKMLIQVNISGMSRVVCQSEFGVV